MPFISGLGVIVICPELLITFVWVGRMIFFDKWLEAWTKKTKVTRCFPPKNYHGPFKNDGSEEEFTFNYVRILCSCPW